MHRRIIVLQVDMFHFYRISGKPYQSFALAFDHDFLANHLSSQLDENRSFVGADYCYFLPNDFQNLVDDHLGFDALHTVADLHSSNDLLHSFDIIHDLFYHAYSHVNDHAHDHARARDHDRVHVCDDLELNRNKHTLFLTLL